MRLSSNGGQQVRYIARVKRERQALLAAPSMSVPALAYGSGGPAGTATGVAVPAVDGAVSMNGGSVATPACGAADFAGGAIIGGPDAGSGVAVTAGSADGAGGSVAGGDTAGAVGAPHRVTVSGPPTSSVRPSGPPATSPARSRMRS